MPTSNLPSLLLIAISQRVATLTKPIVPPTPRYLLIARKLQIEIPPQKAEENMGIQQQAPH